MRVTLGGLGSKWRLLRHLWHLVLPSTVRASKNVTLRVSTILCHLHIFTCGPWVFAGVIAGV